MSSASALIPVQTKGSKVTRWATIAGLPASSPPKGQEISIRDFEFGL
jgi:hypothetical protein